MQLNKFFFKEKILIMKRGTKIATLATTVLVGITTVSVGFASWVISKSVNTDAHGNVKAQAVAEDNITIESTAYGDLAFGYSNADASSVSNPWLRDDGNSTVTESLTIKIVFKMSGVDHIDNKYKENGGFIVGDSDGATSNSDKWTKATTYNLISSTASYELINTAAEHKTNETDAQSFYSVDTNGNIKANTDTNIPDMSTQYVLTLSVTFNWGTHFNSSNPYKYYNEKTQTATRDDGYKYKTGGTTELEVDSSATYSSDALASLDWIYKNVNSLYYIFSFVGHSK